MNSNRKLARRVKARVDPGRIGMCRKVCGKHLQTKGEYGQAQRQEDESMTVAQAAERTQTSL